MRAAASFPSAHQGMQYIYIHIFPRYGLTTGNETMVRQGRHPQARILQKLILVVSKLKSSFLDVGICSRTYFFVVSEQR